MPWIYAPQTDLTDSWRNTDTGEVSLSPPSQATAMAAWNTQAALTGVDPVTSSNSLYEYLPKGRYTPDAQGFFDYEFRGKTYRLNKSNAYIPITSNSGYLIYLRQPYYNSFNSAEELYIPDLNARMKEANAGGLFDYMPSIILAAAGAGLTGMLPGTTNVFSGSGLVSGSLDPSGASALADTEQITVSLSETGATNVGETGLEWYSVDPGPDPFATTADVNAGWSFNGGYEGVDWYNSAGIGEASAPGSALNDILGSVSKAVKSVGGILTAGTAALQATRNNLAQPVPNYARSAGGINLGLLAVAAIAWKML